MGIDEHGHRCLQRTEASSPPAAGLTGCELPDMVLGTELQEKYKFLTTGPPFQLPPNMFLIQSFVSMVSVRLSTLRKK